MFFRKNLRIAVWGVSMAIGVVVILSPLLLGQYSPQAPYLIPLNQRINNIITLGLIISLIFPAFVEYSNYRWIRQVESAIPRLLRDISESVRSGMTMAKAVEVSSSKNLGPLSKELEHVMVEFVLGASWDEAVMSMAKRVKSATVSRFATILVEANQAGGKMNEVLDVSVELFSSLDEFKEEQYNNMRPYLFTIYLALGIFLIISYVMLYQFLAPLSLASKGTTSVGGTIANVLDINYYTSILFWASVVESFFGGLIAGKIGDRSYSAGLRHSVILLFMTLVFFNAMAILG